MKASLLHWRNGGELQKIGMHKIMNINGDKVRVHKSDREIFEFLTSLENFEQLMPEDIEAISDTHSDVQLKFEGAFNPMISMMVKKPLTSFINTLTDNLAKL